MRPRRGEQGQATVEFAIVLPLVLLILVGLIEFGKAFNYWLSLNHLANETSRWAAVDKLPPYGSVTTSNNSPNVDAFRQYVLSQISTQELRDKVASDLTGSVKLCYTGGAAPAIGDAAQVTIKTPYRFSLVPISITLAGKSTVRFEQAPASGSGWTPTPC
jgi:Flp pilus assembly protein TadG